MQNNRLKVLLCSPLDKGAVGGISKWTKYIVDYAKLNNDYIELTQFYPKTSKQGRTTSVTRVINGIKSYIPLLTELNDILKRERYDVVHLCTSASISLVKDILSIKIAHKFGCKTVVHFHFGRIPQIFNSNNWEQKLLKKVVSMSDKVITMDCASYNTLVFHRNNNVCNVPNPLSPAITELIDANKDILRDRRKIVFAGHVVKTKGIFELIEACKSIDNIKLHIYGHITDKMRESVIQAAGDNSGKWLDIKGEQASDEVIKGMLSAGIFVLPSYTEGFPNVIIESMACGCPIVTTPVGAIPEILDIERGNKYGICVPVQNAEKLCEAIEYMLNNSKFAISCGKNAQNRVKELYTMNIVWDKLLRVWQTM